MDLDVAVADARAAMEATAVERELNPNLHRDPAESNARHVPLQHVEMARVKELILGTLEAMMARIVSEYGNRQLDPVQGATHTQIICTTKLEIVEGVVVRQNLGDVMPADLTPPAEFREIDIYRGKLAEKPPPLGLRKGSGLGCSSPKDPKFVTV